MRNEPVKIAFTQTNARQELCASAKWKRCSTSRTTYADCTCVCAATEKTEMLTSTTRQEWTSSKKQRKMRKFHWWITYWLLPYTRSRLSVYCRRLALALRICSWYIALLSFSWHIGCQPLAALSFRSIHSSAVLWEEWWWFWFKHIFCRHFVVHEVLAPHQKRRACNSNLSLFSVQ